MLERRFLNSSVRAQGDEAAMVISGRAASFDVLSHDLGGFRERIARGCFSRALQREDQDVMACREHDSHLVLARTKNKTLTLSEDADGLRFRAVLPQTQEAKDTYRLVRDGYLQDCSFAFTCDDEDWDWEPDPDDRSKKIQVRTLRSVTLHDVAVVGRPAYPSTAVSTEVSSQNNPSLGPIRSLGDYFPQGLPMEVRSRLASVTSNPTERLDAIDLELDQLTSASTLGRRGEKRVDFLLSEKAKLMRENRGDLKNYEVAKLLEQGGNLRRLPDKIEREWRSALKGDSIPTRLRPSESEVRANLAGTQSLTFAQAAAGGAFVPTGIFDRLLSTGKQYDELFSGDFSNQIVTQSGNTIPAPILDDANNSSVLTTETSAGVEADLANFSAVQLGAYPFRSGYVAVSLELLQDLPDEFPIGALLERAFALRHARGIGAKFATGSGVNQPTGLQTAVVGSGAVPVIASGSSNNTGGSETGSTSVGTADLATCFRKLNPYYRRNAVWFMNPDTLDYLQSLVSKQGTEVVNFRKGFGKGDDVPYVLGRPVALCPSLATLGAAANVIFFGDPTYFITRLARDSAYIQRITQSMQALTFGLILFQSYLRADSNLLAPNSQALPFQFIQTHS